MPLPSLPTSQPGEVEAALDKQGVRERSQCQNQVLVISASMRLQVKTKKQNTASH